MDNKVRIVKVRKDEEGTITDVMMEDGTVYPIEEAINMTREDKIADVNVGRSKSGTQFLRADPDGEVSNNLDQLPTF